MLFPAEAPIMRRTLLVDANVSALLEANIPKDATSEEVAAAIAVRQIYSLPSLQNSATWAKLY